jgi:hypothetical protein
MESQFNQRWYGISTNGTHTFYIQVHSSNLIEDFHFETSLPINLFQDKELHKLVKRLCTIRISTFKRNEIALIIINTLDHVPGIKKYYFNELVLDKNGKYCEEYDIILNEIKANIPICENVPYSQLANESIFTTLKSNFIYDEVIRECKQISKSEFEQQINGNFNLQHAYLEVYRFDAEHYSHISKTEGTCIEYCAVVFEQELTFIFFKRLSEVRSVET